MTAAVEARPKEIVGSTGDPGVSRRDPGRLYLNARTGVIGSHEVDTLTHNFSRLVRTSRRMGPDTRAVLRVAVDDPTARIIFSSEHPLAQQVEYAVPISSEDSLRGRRWLVGLAHNGPERRSTYSVDNIVRDTSPETYTNEPKSVLQRVESIQNKGYSLTTHITEEMKPQLLSLWKDTFGWTEENINTLAERLKNQEALEPHDKKVWFTGIMHGKELVAVSMGERLDLPLDEDGNTLTLVENTEWKSKRPNEGLLATAVAVTNAQVLHDLKGQDPFIYAECNYYSRADQAAYAVGMEMPARVIPLDETTGEVQVFPQTLMQNVAVDGVQSDFTYWHLSPEGRERYYSDDQINEVIDIIR